MPDRGLTHVAFLVGDIDATTSFYRDYAAMQIVHERADPAFGSRVAWITDHTRPFVLVLIQAPDRVPRRRLLSRLLSRLLPPFAHLGVACASSEEVDQLCERARREGCLAKAPKDLGPPVGYFGLIRDPDGNILEVAYGQEVGLAVEPDAPGSQP